MRKITMLNHVSIDGYFASLNQMTGGMDWFVHDPKVDEYVHSFGESDALILGDITYKMFQSSWVPILNDPNADPGLKKFAQELTDMKKIVFSKDLKESDWANSEFHDGNITDVVRKLKEGDGKEIMVMGSGTIVQQLTNEHLIDEYMFIMTPVIAGEGKPLFKDVKQLGLKLIDVKPFDSGNVVMRYEVGK